MVNPHNDEPPYEKKGRGIPITGDIPNTIPIFMARWNVKIEATQ